MKLRGLWWWIDRWRKSTAYTDMTVEQQGAYRNLLDEGALRGGPIPNDENILKKACGDPRIWNRVRSAVLPHFYEAPDGLRNTTLDEVIAESHRRASKQRDYRARRGNDSGNAPGNTGGNKVGNRLGNATGNEAGNGAVTTRVTDSTSGSGSGSVRTEVLLERSSVLVSPICLETGGFQAEDALTALQEAYPQNRVTSGYRTETAWIEQLGDSPASVFQTMLSNLENHKQSHEWRVKGMIPALDKWLREGLWKRMMDEEAPADERLSAKSNRTLAAAAKVIRGEP